MKDGILELIYNSLTLLHSKKDNDVKTQVNERLEKNKVEFNGKSMKVDSLLNLTCAEFLQTNANEAMGTELAWEWKEFVDQEILMTEIIDRVSKWDSLLSLITPRRMGGKKVTYPAKWKRRRMNLTDESVNVPWTTEKRIKAKTLNVTLESFELSATIYIPDTLLEDSVINMAQYVLDELTEAYESSAHHIILNGDTETAVNSNINIIDGAVGSLEFSDVLLADGARKNALAAADGFVNAWVLDLGDFRDWRSKMGVKGLDPTKIVAVIEPKTYFKLLGLSQIETIEKFGDAATVKNGVITAIDGMKVMPREELGKTTATWEISATPANNTKGQVVLIHLPSINFWTRRDFRTEPQREASERRTSITGSARVALTIDENQTAEDTTLSTVVIGNITI